ncbi:hypothetical protein [Gimesia algae]|nr:hypothetical protein [Gimesia algae]
MKEANRFSLRPVYYQQSANAVSLVLTIMPCECDGRTMVFGTIRRGSTPW